MSELTKNINYIFGYVLLYSVIIFTTLSALLGGIVVYPIYGVIYIIKKIKAYSVKNEIVVVEEVTRVEVEKKPIIDENWCNISVKNIINYRSEEAATNEIEIESTNEIAEATNEIAEAEEILSIRRPSEEELRQFQKEEEEAEAEAEDVDNSPNDKYSIGHYKSKTNINDPLDFDN
jgi:hypothetical protein